MVIGMLCREMRFTLKDIATFSVRNTRGNTSILRCVGSWRLFILFPETQWFGVKMTKSFCKYDHLRILFLHPREPFIFYYVYLDYQCCLLPSNICR